MRARRFVLGAGSMVVLAAAGCHGAVPPVGPPSPPAVRGVAVSAASAGGACILWDFPVLEERLGVLFDVAAAGQAKDTSTCVVASTGADRPDLMLSVVEHTDAGVALFREELTPAGAGRVKKLGRAAYRQVSRATAERGPVVEVGWLSADQQLLSLRFTFALGATPADAADMAGRLITMARIMSGDDGA